MKNDHRCSVETKWGRGAGRGAAAEGMTRRAK